MRRLTTTLLVSGLLASGLLHGQQPPGVNALQFDVVSIKVNNSGEGKYSWSELTDPGARWFTKNGTIAGVIHTAYPSKVREIIGAPGWVTIDHYDIEARAAFDPTPDQRKAMVRRMLADDFKLVTHFEPRERPVYNLVIARADRRLGGALQPVDVDCANYDPKAPGVAPRQAPNDVPACSYHMRAGPTMTITSGGRTMEFLADVLAGPTERPVIDKTGLRGYYAFDIRSDPQNGPSIFTALQEQLGLKLESSRAPVDVLVIDHIERPPEQ